MPIQPVDQEIQPAVTELNNLVSYAKAIGLPRSFLIPLVPKLSRIELMILDSAFREMDLIKLRNTVLVIPEQYLDMLQNVTDCLITQIKRFKTKR